MSKIGDYGEALALAYLRRKGYEIIEKNYRRPFGEIDIVAKDRETVVFVEVKTRHPGRYGTAIEAVDRHKRERLIKTALDYLVRHGLHDAAARFDVVAVSLDARGQAKQIELIQNAFECVE